MADAAVAAFGRRVSTTDYVSLVGRTSLPNAVEPDAQPLVAKATGASGIEAELRILLGLALPVVCDRRRGI